MVRKAWHLLLVIALLAAVAATTGCRHNGTSGVSTEVGDRMPIEGCLKIIDAEAIDLPYRSHIYALVAGHEYTLRYTAEKWMGKNDAQMDMRIELPPHLQQIGGDTAWCGQDKKMTIEVQVRPIEVGETEVTATVTNLVNDYWFTNTITVHVTGTVAEAKHFFDKPAKKQIQPVKVIEDMNE